MRKFTMEVTKLEADPEGGKAKKAVSVGSVEVYYPTLVELGFAGAIPSSWELEGKDGKIVAATEADGEAFLSMSKKVLTMLLLRCWLPSRRTPGISSTAAPLRSRTALRSQRLLRSYSLVVSVVAKPSRSRPKRTSRSKPILLALASRKLTSSKSPTGFRRRKTLCLSCLRAIRRQRLRMLRLGARRLTRHRLSASRGSFKPLAMLLNRLSPSMK